MRIYIKGDYTKEIPFDYLELANKMWFESYQGEGIPYGYLELAGKMWFPEDE